MDIKEDHQIIKKSISFSVDALNDCRAKEE